MLQQEKPPESCHGFEQRPKPPWSCHAHALGPWGPGAQAHGSPQPATEWFSLAAGASRGASFSGVSARVRSPGAGGTMWFRDHAALHMLQNLGIVGNKGGINMYQLSMSRLLGISTYIDRVPCLQTSSNDDQRDILVL